MTIFPFNRTKYRFLEFTTKIHDDSNLYNMLIINKIRAVVVFWH